MTDAAAVSAAEAADDQRRRQGGRAVLLSMHATLRNLRLYPVENAAVQKALDELEGATAALLAADGEVAIRLVGDFLFVDEVRLRLELDNYASFGHILTLFRTFGIGTLRLRQGLARREWQAALSALLALSAQPDREDPFAPIEERFAALGIEHIGVERALEEGEGGAAAEGRELARQCYAQGVAVTREIIGSARVGRAGSLRKVKRAVQVIVDQVLTNETSILGLTTIRDFDAYTFTHSVNVCILAVALGRKLGFTRPQLYELGLAALLHDIGKARIPADVLRKPGGLDDAEWRLMQSHTWRGALSLFALRGYEEIPYRAVLVAYEHHLKPGGGGYPQRLRPREPGLFSRIVALVDGFDAATSRRVYQTTPIEPDEVLRGMYAGTKGGFDKVLVKSLINLIGIYPVGTCVILDTFELGIVQAPGAGSGQLNRPAVRLAMDADGAALPAPGRLVDLAEQGSDGQFLRTIVKVTDPTRYGLIPSDYVA